MIGHWPILAIFDKRFFECDCKYEHAIEYNLKQMIICHSNLY